MDLVATILTSLSLTELMCLCKSSLPFCININFSDASACAWTTSQILFCWGLALGERERIHHFLQDLGTRGILLLHVILRNTFLLELFAKPVPERVLDRALGCGLKV